MILLHPLHPVNFVIYQTNSLRFRVSSFKARAERVSLPLVVSCRFIGYPFHAAPCSKSKRHLTTYHSRIIAHTANIATLASPSTRRH